MRSTRSSTHRSYALSIGELACTPRECRLSIYGRADSDNKRPAARSLICPTSGPTWQRQGRGGGERKGNPAIIPRVFAAVFPPIIGYPVIREEPKDFIPERRYRASRRVASSRILKFRAPRFPPRVFFPLADRKAGKAGRIFASRSRELTQNLATASETHECLSVDIRDSIRFKFKLVIFWNFVSSFVFLFFSYVSDFSGLRA